MIGALAYDGAETGRLMKDQPTWDIHPQDAFAQSGEILLARGGHLVRNNAYAKALINAMQNGVVGPHGLLWKSLYQADDDDAVSDAERLLRHRLTNSIRKACRHIDASGLLTYRQWEDSLVYGKAVLGASIKIRVMKQRPQATHATAWRDIHPARISNPNHSPDTDRLYQGVALDDDGSPLGLWIQSRHPHSYRQRGKQGWTYVPLLDANGIEQVIWHSARTEPEQIHAPGWFAPVMGLLVHLGKVTEAHVVAKRLQACLGMIVESPDPVAAARADRNGVLWTRNTTIEPGKTYYVRTGTNVRPFDFKYDGADFESFTTSLLQSVCAGFGSGMPWQFVLQQLTKSNMASARAALMQAWRSFRAQQVDHEHELRIVVKNYIAEDIARGRLALPTGDDLEAACAGYFVPPQRLTPDDYRDMQAAELKHGVLGISKSTLAREHGGYDLDDERIQDREDRAEDERVGLTRPPRERAPDLVDDDALPTDEDDD